ncbi:MAG TPA: transglycosylase domain-containing protein [Gaiellaceae bacterium]|nr:transglycosylase domain-containing protein [Gaiellaceae bacterium]
MRPTPGSDREQPDLLLLAAQLHRSRLRRRRRRSRTSRLLAGVVAAALAAIGFGVVFVEAGGANALIASDCSLRAMRPIRLGENSFVYAVNGARLGAVASNTHRQALALREMSPWLPKATIAIEDRRFYQHGGIDYLGIARAAYADLSAGRIVEGGSTLEQELARNLYLGNDTRTLSWKLEQACLAIKIAQRWSRAKILDAYLNQVSYGAHAFGVAAAARTYYSKPASRLTLPEAAMIAGLPQAPSAYDPFSHPAVARARRNEVLAAMYRDGQISRRVWRRALRQPLGLRMGTLYVAVDHPGFVGYVELQLLRRFGTRTVRAGGLAVTTTLQIRLQRDAKIAARSVLLHHGDPAAAIVAIDPSTGAVDAMTSYQPGVGDRAFNLAAEAHRQAGSAFKPFVLATALEQGYSLGSSFAGPPQFVVSDPVCNTGSQPWIVNNYANESFGSIPLSTAIANSVNTVFAQLVSQVGPANVVALAHRVGISSPLQAVCSITLGSQAVTPLEMTDAYATFADNGIHHPVEAVEMVRAPNGHLLARPHTAGTRAVSANVADTVTQALRGVVQGGTGTAAAIPGLDVVGKTGTSEHEEDAWFCGYIPGRLATCVWVGYPAGEIPMHNIDGVPSVVGGTLAAEIWHNFVAAATSARP